MAAVGVVVIVIGYVKVAKYAHSNAASKNIERINAVNLQVSLNLNLNGCSAKPLLGHHALVRVVGFWMAGFMLSGR